MDDVDPVPDFMFGHLCERRVAAEHRMRKREIGNGRHDGRGNSAQRKGVAQPVFDENAMIGLGCVGIQRGKDQNAGYIRHRFSKAGVVAALGSVGFAMRETREHFLAGIDVHLGVNPLDVGADRKQGAAV